MCWLTRVFNHRVEMPRGLTGHWNTVTYKLRNLLLSFFVCSFCLFWWWSFSSCSVLFHSQCVSHWYNIIVDWALKNNFLPCFSVCVLLLCFSVCTLLLGQFLFLLTDWQSMVYYVVSLCVYNIHICMLVIYIISVFLYCLGFACEISVWTSMYFWCISV